MVDNPNSLSNNNDGQNPTGWESLSDYDAKNEQASQFTNEELKRLAKITGRVPDDEGVIGLNLALRWKEYQKRLNAYNEARRTGTMMQQGPMEDLATAKRELEEAMYLYDESFRKRDAEISKLNEEQRRHNIKDREKARQPGSGRHMSDLDVRNSNPEDSDTSIVEDSNSGMSWVQARLQRNRVYDEKRGNVEQSRDAAAERLAQDLPGIVEGIEQSEVYLTYDLNKEDEPSIKERRDGFKSTGKKGFYGKDHEIDLTLYPHAPDEPVKPNEGDSNSPGDPNNPDGDSDNPDNSEGDNTGKEDDPDDKEKAKRQAEKEKAIKEKEEMLAACRQDFAERYAKNRSIIPGYRDKDDFLKKREDYEKSLDDLLESKADLAWEKEYDRIGAELEKELAELDTEDENYEEKKKALLEKFDKEYEKSRNAIKAQFVEDFVNEQRKLEEETIDKLDNGGPLRKIIHAFRSNKKVKAALAVAAVAGLGVAVVASGGLAGAGAIGLGYQLTGAGFAAGAAKGAIGGFLTSRQDSKTSAVRGYESMNEEEIRSRLEKILSDSEQGDNSNWLGLRSEGAEGGTGGDEGAENGEEGDAENGEEGEKGEKNNIGKTRDVASWILGEYEKANDADYAGNWKRTAKGVLIGGVLGGLASGVKIVRTDIVETPGDLQVDLSKVDIPEGHGAYDTFTQLGGDPKDLDKALDIMRRVDLQSSGQFVPGSNGETMGLGGAIGDYAHTYPGKISTWPSAAQTYIEAVAKEWANAGLIDVTREVTREEVKRYISIGLLQFLAGAAGGDVVGGIHSTMDRTSPPSVKSSQLGEGTNGSGLEQSNQPGENGETAPSRDVATREELERWKENFEKALDIKYAKPTENSETVETSTDTATSAEKADWQENLRQAVERVASQSSEQSEAEPEQPKETMTEEEKNAAKEALEADMENRKNRYEPGFRNEISIINGSDPIFNEDDISIMLEPSTSDRVIDDDAFRRLWDRFGRADKDMIRDFIARENYYPTKFGTWLANNPDPEPVSEAERLGY